MKIIIVFFLAGIICVSVNAQLAMGKWRTHFAYNSVSQIAQSENKIFAVSDGALFSVDKEDGTMEFYSKLSGLNDANISRIEYDDLNKQLLIVYVNGNIDVLSSGGVVNIPDLYNKQMSASKLVNQILFYEKKAFLACDFGILVLNSEKMEVADTYVIGPNGTEIKILNTAIYGDSIYAVTSSIVYEASVKEPMLVNYQLWNTAKQLPGSGDYQYMGTFAGNLFLLRSNKLYIKNSAGSWEQFLSDISVTDIHVSNGKMLIFDGGNSEHIIDSQLNVTHITNIGYIPDAEYDNKADKYWFAGQSSGVISYKQSEVAPVYYKPEGPSVNIPWNMTFAGQKLFVVPGGRWSAQLNRAGAVMMYENNKWTNIYSTEIKAQTGQDALDFMNVAVDPADSTHSHFFVSSYGTGLYEFKNNAFSYWYNTSNSTLETHPAVPTLPNQYTRLDGAVFDAQGNLFVANSAVAANIKLLSKNGIWSQLKYTGTTRETLGKILINSQNPNQKWMLSVRSGEIIVFDDKGTLTSQLDDQYSVLKSFPDPDNEGSYITPTTCFDIAQDKNGVMWVGTEQGPLLFYNTSKVFDSGYTCSRVKIPRNDGTDLADYLLIGEKVKAIAIDGANRKWIGTESSGVYLMSENGQETIKHFTVTNSPLLSNDILSIAINPVTGEVFFGTGQGIVSYQSDAAEGAGSFSNVYAYPNPVRPGYNGVITITGLIDNTQVHITDITGNLVCKTVSNGSIATWDGKDVHGRKVNTGIYLVLCANEDGTQTTVTKIMVIN